jgi:hypothetical protein
MQKDSENDPEQGSIKMCVVVDMISPLPGHIGRINKKKHCINNSRNRNKKEIYGLPGF